jgi:hypothetical protein
LTIGAAIEVPLPGPGTGSATIYFPTVNDCKRYKPSKNQRLPASGILQQSSSFPLLPTVETFVKHAGDTSATGEKFEEAGHEIRSSKDGNRGNTFYRNDSGSEGTGNRLHRRNAER